MAQNASWLISSCAGPRRLGKRPSKWQGTQVRTGPAVLAGGRVRLLARGLEQDSIMIHGPNPWPIMDTDQEARYATWSDRMQKGNALTGNGTSVA